MSAKAKSATSGHWQESAGFAQSKTLLGRVLALVAADSLHLTHSPQSKAQAVELASAEAEAAPDTRTKASAEEDIQRTPAAAERKA